MPRSSMGHRPISPPLVDSPVSDDATFSFIVPSIPRFTKPSALVSAQDVQQSSQASTPEGNTFGVGSPYSPSSIGSNQPRAHMTSHPLFAESPDGGNHLPSVTPSPNEAPSLPGRSLSTSDYFLPHPYVPSPNFPCHDFSVSVPQEVALFSRTSALHMHRRSGSSTTDRRLSEPILALTSPFLMAIDTSATRLAGVFSAHPDLNEGPNPFKSPPPVGSDGSWALSVALGPDSDGDDQDVFTSFPGGHGGRSTGAARNALAARLSNLSAGEPPHAPSYTPGRVSGFVPPQDDSASTVVPASSTLSGGQPHVPTSSLSYPRVPLASSAADPSLSPGEGIPDTSRTYSFVPLPGNNVKKRPRRRYDEIERLYKCSFILPSVCHHHFASASMSLTDRRAWQLVKNVPRHTGRSITSTPISRCRGMARSVVQMVSPYLDRYLRSTNMSRLVEFKELRKQWRKAKKDAETLGMGASPERSMYGGPAPSDPRRVPRPALGLQIPSSYDPSAPSPAGVGPYTPITPTHPYGVSADTAQVVYPQSTIPTGLGFAVPNVPSSSLVPSGSYDTSSHHDPGHRSPVIEGSSAWSSPLSSRYSLGRYSQVARLSGQQRSLSDYTRHQPLEEPAPAGQQDYGQQIAAAYASASQYTGSYGVYSPSMPASTSAQRYPTSSGVAPTETYLPSNYFLGSQPAPSDTQESSPTQEELSHYAARSTLLTPLPGYQPPPPEPNLPEAVSTTAYASAVPRTAGLSAVPALMHGAWREASDSSGDVVAHQARRHP
jgi:hypothetical protein